MAVVLLFLLFLFLLFLFLLIQIFSSHATPLAKVLIIILVPTLFPRDDASLVGSGAMFMLSPGKSRGSER